MKPEVLTRDLPPIHLVPSFHYDVVYLKSYQEYLEMSLAIIDRALDILSADPDYTFTMEQVILLEEFWSLRPEKRELLQKFFDAGRFDVAPAMYAMPDMNMIDGESMFMQAKVGKDWLLEHLGIEQDSCWIADCWGHHAQLPQILTQAGYKYYFFWRCMRRNVMKNEFIWQGIDGTGIKTHWLSTGYADLSFPDDGVIENALELDFKGVSADDINALYFKRSEYGVPAGAVLMCNGGDFRVPQTSAPEIVRRLNAGGNTPPIKFSTPTKYMESLDWSKMDACGGEFNTAFQGTFTTNIKIKQYSHYLGNRLQALEKFAVLTGNRLDLLPEWKILLKQQFHDTICGTICDAGLADTYAEFRQLEQQLDAKFAQLNSAGPAGVFNPLSFARTEYFTRSGRGYKATVPPLGIVKLDDCESIDCTETSVQLPCSFANDFYSAEVDASGYISSLIESQSVQQLINPGPCPFGALALQIDHGDSWLNFDCPLTGGSVEAALNQNDHDPLFRTDEKALVFRGTVFPDISEASAEESATGLQVVQKGLLQFWAIKVPFEIRIEFSRISPVIKYTAKLCSDSKGFRIRAAFPTTLAYGSITQEIPYGIQERGESEFPVQAWMNLAYENTGAALFNRGIPGNNVDNGTMLLTLFRSVAMEYKTQSADSFNQGVPQEFEYAFMPHANASADEIVRRAHAFTNPLIMVNNFIDREYSLSGSKNIYISALRWSDDKIFIRLYEATGSAGQVNLSLPDDISEYWLADGLQRPVSEKFQVSGGLMDLSFKPFEVKNILLK